MRIGIGCSICFSAALLAGCFALPAFAETKAGVATSVENNVIGILNGNQKQLTPGSDVYMDQTVRTEEESTTQLLLLDKTNISVGTKSEIVLDRFVFDPNRPQGDVVINATRGVFRFVTGTQDHNSYHIKTPAATIGVRGTVVEFNIPSIADPNDKDPKKKVLEVLLKYGAVDVTLNNGEKISMNDPDKLLEVYAGGGYNTSNYVGSLYAAIVGDITGGIGRGAGGAGGGGTPFTPHQFTNGGSNRTVGGGSTPKLDFFTFNGTNAPNNASQRGSP